MRGESGEFAEFHMQEVVLLMNLMIGLSLCEKRAKVSLGFQSECGKILTRKNSYLNTFQGVFFLRFPLNVNPIAETFFELLKGRGLFGQRQKIC